MFRATTPTHNFICNNIYIEDISKVVITYCQDGRIILEKNKSDCELSGDTISLTLSQEETKLFYPGKVNIQVRIMTNDGVIMNSKIYTIEVEKALNEEVLKNDD